MHLSVRDDGSTDGSAALLSRYRLANENVDVEFGRRVGVVESFLTLLANASPDYAYYALSDQDDVWLSNKLEVAVAQMEARQGGRPLLYCGRVEYVSETLQRLGYSKIPRYTDLSNALVENIAPGCTIVLNAVARQAAALCRPLPGTIFMHDWWLYLTAAFLGGVVYDPTPHVRYRRHSMNVIGPQWSPLLHAASRLTSFGRLQRARYRPVVQARELLRCHSPNLRTEERGVIARFVGSRAGLKSRLRYAIAKEVRRQSGVDDALLRALIFLGWY